MKRYVIKDLIFIGIIALFIVGFKYGPDYFYQKPLDKQETAESREARIVRIQKWFNEVNKNERRERELKLKEMDQLGPDTYQVYKEFHDKLEKIMAGVERSAYRRNMEGLRGH